MSSTQAHAVHPPATCIGPVVLAFSVFVAGQLHWLYRHHLTFVNSWRLALAALPAVALYGFSRTTKGRAWCARLPGFWDRWLCQSWILLPGALADPLFPFVTLAAWGAAVAMDRSDSWAPLRRRVDALPRAWITFGLMSLALVLIVVRAPELFVEPRFWAEDGVWFKHAYNRGVREFLFFVREYSILYSNVVAVISAELFAVELAPAVATLAALLVPFAALYLIATADVPPFDTPGRKLIAMLLLLLIPPSAETWLFVMGAQYTFVLICALILMEERPPATPARRWFYRALLGMAGLTGVLTCLLTPLFAYKWYRARARETAIQAGILAAASLVQFSAMAWLGAEHRSLLLPSWSTVALVAVNRHILEPINLHWAVGFWKTVPADALRPAIFGAVLLAAVYGWIWRQLREHWRMRLVLLFALGLLLFSITFAFVHGAWGTLIEPNGVVRYFYAPNVLLALCLFGALLLWRRKGGAGRSVAATFVVAVLLASGALDYFALNEKPMRVLEAKWPKWSGEVARWRDNPDYRLRFAPTGWSAKLNPRPDDSTP